jgi:hypothetical protein
MDYVGSNPNPAFVGFTKMPPPPTISTWNAPIVPQIGNLFTFRNAANPNGVVANANGTLIIQDPSTINLQDGTFNVVPANNGADGYISLQAYGNSNIYMRHSSLIGYMMTNDGSDLFHNDSSFKVVQALNGKPNMFSLQSYNYPDNYLMTATNPNGSIQLVVRIPGAATDNASWYGSIPLMLTQ